MKFIKLLILGLTVYYLQNCTVKNDADYNLNNLYPGDKMVLNGFIDVDSGCVVNLSKTALSSGRHLNSELQFTAARIFLIENGDTINELEGDINGRFKTVNFIPKVGAKYKIAAISSKLPGCESEEVVYLPEPNLKNIAVQIKDNLVYGRKGLLFSFNLLFSTDSVNYYIYTAIQDGNYNLSTSFLNEQTMSTSINSCDYFGGNFYGGFSTRCFQSGDTLKFAGDFDYGNGQLPKYFSFILSGISPSLRNYIVSTHQPKGLETAFTQPNILYTNIKGGYGVFYTLNSKKITYKF